MAKLTPRQLLLKARIYRFFGLVFAAVGFFVMLAVFSYAYKGDIELVAQEPAGFMTVVIPFIPSFILFWIADRADKKAITMLENQPKNT